jgi:excisionase family DNA binding protein
MTPAELSQYLGMAERTIYQWATQEKMPAIKIGSNWRFRRNEIDAWLEDNHSGPSYNNLSTDRRSIGRVSEWEKNRSQEKQREALIAACIGDIVKSIAETTSDQNVIGLHDLNHTWGVDVVKRALDDLKSNKSLDNLGFKVNEKYKDISNKKITVIERRK